MSDRDLASLIKDRNGAIWRVPGTQKSVRCTIFEIHGNGIRNVLYNFYDVSEGGGGGGQKTKWKTPSSNFEELIESITNMLLFFAGGSRKKSYEVSKFDQSYGDKHDACTSYGACS